MMKGFLRLSALLLVCTLLALAGQARAQESSVRYFDETGHNVRGEFLEFYNRVASPTLLYGYPITEQFEDRNGLTVQYFQRARFELRPERPAGQRVQLTPLGRLLYTPGESIAPFNPAGCRVFASGYPVCYGFLDFYLQHGGEVQFGQPISSFEYRGDLLVQYFEYARLEYHPWRQAVVPSDLGRIAFEKWGEDPGRLSAVPRDDFAEPQLVELRAYAFPWKPITLASDNQILFIVVQNQNLQPLANAQITAQVRWPDGSTTPYTVRSGPAGVGVITLNFNALPHGELITVEVTAQAQGQTARTVTSFRIWK